MTIVDGIAKGHFLRAVPGPKLSDMLLLVTRVKHVRSYRVRVSRFYFSLDTKFGAVRQAAVLNRSAQTLPPGGSCRRRQAVTEEECGQECLIPGNAQASTRADLDTAPALGLQHDSSFAFAGSSLSVRPGGVLRLPQSSVQKKKAFPAETPQHYHLITAGKGSQHFDCGNKKNLHFTPFL